MYLNTLVTSDMFNCLWKKVHRLWWLGLFLVILLSTGSARAKPAAAPVMAKVIFKQTTFVVEVVEDPKNQSKGLGGRIKLGANEGMLFLYTDADRHRFWMKGMKIPIDIIWLNNGLVVHIAHRVPPPSSGTALADLPVYEPKKPANLVLEIAAGRAKDLGIKKGDYLRVRF